MKEKIIEVKPKETKTNLDTVQLKNLIVIVSTHPTPEGVGSEMGQVKIQLVNILSKMLDEAHYH